MSARSRRGGRRVRTFLATRVVELLGVCLLAAGLTACGTYPVPTSAQIGSTVVFPVGGLDIDIGYGGSDYTDYQRGMIVYRLRDTDPVVELTTRLSMLATAPTASWLAQTSSWERGLFSGPPFQLISLVDITPSNGTSISPGSYQVDPVWRRNGQADVPMTSYYHTSLKILPAIIDPDGPGGLDPIEGTPTPAPQGDPSLFAQAIPRPRIRVTLAPGEIRAFELELEYPKDVIDVVDAVYSDSASAPPNARPIIWMEDDEETGRVKVSGMTHPMSLDVGYGLFGFGEIGVVFELIDGSTQILEFPNPELHVTEGSVVAYDINGQEVAATANLLGIR